MHETRLNFAYDFGPLEDIRDIRHLMKTTVKVVKMYMIDMSPIMKAAKHLIKKEIKKHVHQKNYAARQVSVQICKSVGYSEYGADLFQLGKGCEILPFPRQ